jgi:hypothetical protein
MDVKSYLLGLSYLLVLGSYVTQVLRWKGRASHGPTEAQQVVVLQYADLL